MGLNIKLSPGVALHNKSRNILDLRNHEELSWLTYDYRMLPKKQILLIKSLIFKLKFMILIIDYNIYPERNLRILLKTEHN